MPVILGVVLLFFSIRKSVFIFSSGMLAGIIAQFLKRIIFPDMVRPVKYFEGVQELYLVEGVTVHSSFSFPSGHAATVFALCFCLSIFAKKDLVKFMLFLLAVVVAFSRVYLSQHFLNDILAGSALGCIAASFMYLLLKRVNKSWFDEPMMKLLTQNKKHE
jgi:membrane-associated phospholipid phosphatase